MSMFTPVAGWMAAAHTAIVAALPNATVSLGPLVNVPGGGDIVVVGHDGDDELGIASQWSGGWHGATSGAPESGEALVFITAWSRSGGDKSMADRLTAAGTLHGSVMGACVPSASGSALGVSGVLWAEQADVRTEMRPTADGNQVRMVITVRLRVLAAV